MEPLRPAHEVYHRLRWGGDVQLDEVEIVVLDRVRGTLLLPFGAFDPRGPIPFSRVLGFRIAGAVVWDRQDRIDRVLGSGSTPGERLSGAAAQAGSAGPAPAAGSTAGAQATVGPAEGLPGPTLRVLTYNVLFDRFDQELVRTAERIRPLMALLQGASADLIALQEVEQPLLAALLAEPWVQEQYEASDDAQGATVEPYGQVLLSRAPLSDVRVVPIHGNKRHLLATVRIGGRACRVAVVHLSSDIRQGGAQRRTRELEVLRDALGQASPCLVLGDVNQDEPLGLALDDAWLQCNPSDPGYTYDPERNALARQLSSTGRRRRLDRVLVRGLEALDARLVGVDPGPLPPSDHHGIVARLRLPEARVAHPAALVVPVPPSVAGVLEPFRRRLDPGRWRWRPHLTLFHEEVTPEALASWLPAARAVLRGQRLPPLVLDRVEIWSQRSRRLVVACTDAASTEALRRLRASLPPGPWGEPAPLQPHVTLARLVGHGDEEVRRIASVLGACLPQRLEVPRLALWARIDAGPMQPAAQLPLADSPEPAPLDLDAILSLEGIRHPARVDGLAALQDRIEAVAGCRPALVGSAGLGAALPESDLDLVIRSDDPLGDRRRLAAALGGRSVDGQLPTLELIERIDGLSRSVDVAFLPRAVGGPEDELDAIREATREQPGFGAVLRLIKAWAAARQVDDPAWGFPGGLAYAVAVASCAPRPGIDAQDPESWILRTLEALLGPEPIALGGAPVAAGEGPRPWVWTSCPPRRTVIRQLLPCTAEVLRDELERALLLLWDDDWRQLVLPVHPSGGTCAWVELGGGAGPRDAALGWLRGRARRLIEVLSEGDGRVRPMPRPIPRRGGIVRVGVVLDGVPQTTIDAALAELHERWRQSSDRPAGATLAHRLEPA